jgi:hypothetical protein
LGELFGDVFLGEDLGEPFGDDLGDVFLGDDLGDDLGDAFELSFLAGESAISTGLALPKGFGLFVAAGTLASLLPLTSKDWNDLTKALETASRTKG